MPPWTMLIDPISRLLDHIIPDPQVRARAKAELINSEREADMKEIALALQADQMQTNINQLEAGNASLFVAGWRPFIGWVCGFAFSYHFIVQPLLAFLIANAGGAVKLPVFDIEALYTVLMGMLGLGSLRTVEKIKGAA